MTGTPELPRLDALLALFYADPAELGRFTSVEAAAMPAPYRTLLAHHSHMTVTVERFHQSPVDVRVLATAVSGDLYSRKILLLRQSDGAVVQYGIVRLNFAHLGPDVRREVESQQTPLGRVLIKHKVMREVHLSRLWRVEPGPELQQLFALATPETTYGRTAIIDCNGEPAIELLEIVAPVHDPRG